jgi:hypothetical protein
MSRRVSLPIPVVALAALCTLAACGDDHPSAPPYTPLPAARSFTVELLAGDSLDLTSFAAERLGMLAVASCESATPAVAGLVGDHSVVALSAGESRIRCDGALDTRVDPTVDDGGGDGAHWTWVTFDVHLFVSEPSVPTDSTGGIGA